MRIRGKYANCRGERRLGEYPLFLALKGYGGNLVKLNRTREGANNKSEYVKGFKRKWSGYVKNLIEKRNLLIFSGYLIYLPLNNGFFGFK